MKLFKKNKESYRIAILKYCLENEENFEFVKYEDVYDFMEREGYLLDNEREEIEKGEMSEQTKKKKYIIDEIFGWATDGVSEGQSRMLLADSYFDLLDYFELSEARKASKEARIFSMIAIGVSIFALVLTPLLTKWQIDSPVQIESEIQIQEGQVSRLEQKITSIEDLLKQMSQNQERILSNNENRIDNKK